MSYDGSDASFERILQAGMNTARKVRKLLLRWRLTIKLRISFYRAKDD